MNDDELHASFYRSEQYKESPTERFARLMAEAVPHGPNDPCACDGYTVRVGTDRGDDERGEVTVLDEVTVRDGIAYRDGKAIGTTVERASRPKPWA